MYYNSVTGSCVLFVALLMGSLSAFAQFELPTTTSQLFSGSGNCQTCHASDGIIMFEADEDISPVSLWRSTMMANSAKDPLWLAKAAIESAVFPQHAQLINDRCTVCHAAGGFTESLFQGNAHYTIAESQADSLARDGVTCTVCHQIQSETLGQTESFSGGYEITDAHIIFGPYTEPLTGPMSSETGYLPQAGAHVHESALCATCHTLFTPSLNHEGEVIGSFAEQTPYLEWINSAAYTAGTSCQECHMPRATNAQDIALRPPWHTETRSPFWRHNFVGGNDFMLKLFRDHQSELGVTAEFLQFEDSRVRADEMLQAGIELQAGSMDFVNDTLYADIHVRNLAGHKYPTGIPLRRLWLHVTAYNDAMQVLFESGGWNEDGEITGLDIPYEPHHDIINREDQVQIYEGIMGDVDGQQTYTLLKAVSYLKDNRLPPADFRSTGSFYDTIAVRGLAVQDADFNRFESTEGTGADIVHFRLPNATANIEIELCYQSVTPRLAEYFGAYDLPEANNYSALYSTIANEPVVVAELFLPIETPVAPMPSYAPRGFELLPIFPNPFNGDVYLPLKLQKSSDVLLVIYNQLGQEVYRDHRTIAAGLQRLAIQSRDWSSGQYFAQVTVENQTLSRQLILVK